MLDAIMTEQEETLTREDIRAALLHLAELAVAFEGGGIEVVAPDTALDLPAVDEEAMGCLRELVAQLTKHRERQLERQRQRVAVALHDGLEAVYEQLKGSPEMEIDEALAALISKQGFHPFQADINDLVPDQEELKGGPAMGAAKVLSQFVGREWRSLFNYRKQRASLELCRTAWRRWVPPRLAQAYVTDALRAAIAARDDAPDPPLSDVKDLSPQFLAMLDRRTEAKFRDHLRAMFEMVLLGDLEGLRSRAPELVETVLAQRAEALSLAREHYDGDEERAHADYRRAVSEHVDRQLEGLGLQAPKPPLAPSKRVAPRNQVATEGS
ncbi:MAG: hypothetical protein IT377_07215 [Polyangiaceae bacterium]|nr:hypothetical protein [Polyangiaceae bacterium]